MTFGSLLNLLKVKRDPSRIPLIPVSFNVDLGITDGVEFKGCEMQFSTNPRHYENHEIFINAAGSADELTLECTYNTDLFEELFIRSRLNGFLRFMEEIIENPEQAICGANILSDSDLQLFDAWSTEPADYDRDSTIISMFRDSVKNHPDRTAIEHRGVQVTYRELDLMALSVAGLLKRSGVGKEWLGGGSHPAPGSGETLCRALYGFNESFEVQVSDSLRMVADFGDSEKILAVLPGGITGRQFHPNTTDQIEPFMKGGKVYWWFSDKAIREHTQHTLTLSPN